MWPSELPSSSSGKAGINCVCMAAGTAGVALGTKLLPRAVVANVPVPRTKMTSFKWKRSACRHRAHVSIYRRPGARASSAAVTGSCRGCGRRRWANPAPRAGQPVCGALTVLQGCAPLLCRPSAPSALQPAAPAPPRAPTRARPRRGRTGPSARHRPLPKWRRRPFRFRGVRAGRDWGRWRRLECPGGVGWGGCGSSPAGPWACARCWPRGRGPPLPPPTGWSPRTGRSSSR